MGRNPNDDAPPVDLAVAAGVFIGVLVLAALFWWPLFLYSWHYWVG